MENKKIKNAQRLIYNNIQFKSQLEVMIYKTLLQEGFDVKYEPVTFTLWQGFHPEIPYYVKNKKTRELALDNKKLIDIKYTPDFIFYYNGIRVIIEAKGFQNDVFYIKKKLFRAYLEEDFSNVKIQSLYFEIYTKKELMQAIEIIKDYVKTD
jgi:hypothetical protein